MKNKKPSLLAKIDAARAGDWLASLGGEARPVDTPLDEILNPGRKQIARLTDDELAELIAREPRSKEGQLAASILRVRESWQTPARWALLVSLVALGVSVAALIRSA